MLDQQIGYHFVENIIFYVQLLREEFSATTSFVVYNPEKLRQKSEKKDEFHIHVDLINLIFKIDQHIGYHFVNDFNCYNFYVRLQSYIRRFREIHPNLEKTGKLHFHFLLSSWRNLLNFQADTIL